MDFNYDESQLDLRGLAQQILGDHSDHAALRDLERSGELRFDSKCWKALGQAGLLTIGMSESAGGAGLGVVDVASVIELTGRTAAAVPVWETMGLGLEAIRAAESDPLDWSNSVADGAVLSAGWLQTHSFDPLDPTVTATEGVLSGTLLAVPAGARADGVIVPAREGERLVLYAVDCSQAGVRRIAERTTAGYPDATLELDQAVGHLLGGEEVVRSAYHRAVATKAALILGHCDAALELLANFTKERHQFGVPIASFQAVGHRAADSYIDTESIRLTTLQALWRIDEGMEHAGEVAVAQYWSALGGQRVVHAAVHLHGGVGVDRDYPLHRHFLACKQRELYLGGATAALRNLGARVAAEA